ncbi:DUF1007 family protein [Orrella sp. JC864]|uniref:DUF1007 family protein n=1 Tax=Orrella sp. JC864 TaxID=3120298 RepID=UPI00300BE718
MWIDARATIVFDEQGRMTAIDQYWLFDEMFSVYAMQGQARDKQGNYPPAVLQSMAQDWIQALGVPESHYFTRVTVGGRSLPFGTPRDARVHWDQASSRLALSFVLPLAEPLPPGPLQADVDIYDPTFFVAYAFEDETVRIAPAQAGCAVAYRPPRELDWKTMQQLAEIPPDPDPSVLPEELFAITKSLTHRLEVRCS